MITEERLTATCFALLSAGDLLIMLFVCCTQPQLSRAAVCMDWCACGASCHSVPQPAVSKEILSHETVQAYFETLDLDVHVPSLQLKKVAQWSVKLNFGCFLLSNVWDVTIFQIKRQILVCNCD